MTEEKKKNKCFRARNVCYTMYDKIPNMGGPNQVYNIYGEEICPTTKRLHYQGYVEFDKALGIKKIKLSLGSETVHIEKRLGTQTEAIDYCKKDGKFIEWGELKKQGERTDLKTMVDNLFKNEITIHEIISNNPDQYHLYSKTLLAAEDLKFFNKKRTWMTKGIWLFGATGTGKTKYAYDLDPNLYNWKNDKNWQDLYQGQETVLIDDFRGHIPYNELLKMVDRYEYSVSRRNRCPIPLLAKTIIVTSSLHPKNVYKYLSQDDSLDQLYRRFEIIEYSTDVQK